MVKFLNTLRRSESDTSGSMTSASSATSTTSASQSRWKSPVLWTSLAAQALSVLVLLGVFSTDLSETVNTVIAAMLQLLVLLGVLNNPTSSDSL
jgi:uncharacterized membrane protein